MELFDRAVKLSTQFQPPNLQNSTYSSLYNLNTIVQDGSATGSSERMPSMLLFALIAFGILITCVVLECMFVWYVEYMSSRDKNTIYQMMFVG